MPPIEFQTLMDAGLPEQEIKGRLVDLRAKKKAGMEKDKAPQIVEFNHFIEAEITRLKKIAPSIKSIACRREELDELFRWILKH